MKSYCKRKVISYSDVVAAYGLWLCSAAGHKNKYKVKNEKKLIDDIYHEINSRTLSTAPIRYYTIHDSGKARVIGVQSVKQQVLDYLAVYLMHDFLHAKIGYYQVASVRGKGQFATLRAVRKWVKHEKYYVKMDVRKCYPSVEHQIVKDILHKYIKSDDVLYLCEYLLSTYEHGLNIGSYFSLWIAQLVLSFGYHFVEGLSKVRRDKQVQLVDHQLWYMDDILLMSNDKRNLRSAARQLTRFMRDSLHLQIKPWKICRVGDDEPIDICGFVFRPGRTTLRAKLFIKARKAFTRFKKHPCLKRARRVCAYFGWIKAADTYTARIKYKVDRCMCLAKSLIRKAAKCRLLAPPSLVLLS